MDICVFSEGEGLLLKWKGSSTRPIEARKKGKRLAYDRKGGLVGADALPISSHTSYIGMWEAEW